MSIFDKAKAIARQYHSSPYIDSEEIFEGECYLGIDCDVKAYYSFELGDDGGKDYPSTDNRVDICGIEIKVQGEWWEKKLRDKKWDTEAEGRILERLRQRGEESAMESQLDRLEDRHEN